MNKSITYSIIPARGARRRRRLSRAERKLVRTHPSMQRVLVARQWVDVRVIGGGGGGGDSRVSTAPDGTPQIITGRGSKIDLVVEWKEVDQLVARAVPVRPDLRSIPVTVGGRGGFSVGRKVTVEPEAGVHPIHGAYVGVQRLAAGDPTTTTYIPGNPDAKPLTFKSTESWVKPGVTASRRIHLFITPDATQREIAAALNRARCGVVVPRRGPPPPEVQRMRLFVPGSGQAGARGEVRVYES